MRGWQRGAARTWVGAAALVGASGLAATVAWACADSSCSPVWRLDAPDYACEGRAMLSPGNDTRINLLLLMRSLAPVSDAGASYAKPDWDDGQLGHVFFSWKGLRETLWPQAPEPETAASEPASECAAPKAAQDAFAAALLADKAVAESDRTLLMTLRTKAGCADADMAIKTTSAAGRGYLDYLLGADAFYKGEYPAALVGFASASRSASPWLQETGNYMVIRVALRQAVAKAIDQYGDFAGLDKIDKTAAQAAGEAIDRYLTSYPQGRYAASAQGLRRRVLWLTGQDAALAQSYEAMLRATPGNSEAAADLAEEIDNTLLQREDGVKAVVGGGKTPLLMAVADLKAMRPLDPAKPMPLDAQTLAAQAPAFAGHDDLYGLLGATRAYYAGEAPRTILARLPDAARSASYTPLAFSRQVLRGMALAKAHDTNEAGFWQELMGGAKGLWQGQLAQLGLALRWQRDGRIDQALASASPIKDTTLRQLMLQTMAAPATLRANAADATRPDEERNVARFTLLYKGLTRGAYADFTRDLALVPADPKVDLTAWYGAGLPTPPAQRFTRGQWSDVLPCPPLVQTAATLARDPANQTARLCLGEFYRLNGFDGFALYTPFEKVEQLGRGKDQFRGPMLARDAIYAAIIADKSAAADLRAYALYRAVMCYAPSGANGCAGPTPDYAAYQAQQVSKAQRKAWYDELKARYPTSRWAKSLRYYW
ncbi:MULTISPECIES: hypothetical protein [unclassified Novosphingobium]|uniref:hypothetical protein n=1 Tax=unclassified Novosphingobium TaxID=2644732 RepID=UPI00146A4670|nr:MULTISPECIES: hypothetical protein [unclassified Novosphingobium]NMN03494.1 hypothetical protein [Novosphingobium sp. SG919]NMN86516.1 hypothetical protein [Novosphingobium sp. SG916]